MVNVEKYIKILYNKLMTYTFPDAPLTTPIVNESSAISIGDKDWLAMLGCNLPDTPEEQHDYIRQLNETIRVGSERLGRFSDEGVKENVYGARRLFYDQLPLLGVAIERVTERGGALAFHDLIPQQRYLYGIGVDLAKLGRVAPTVLTYSLENVEEKVRTMLDIGIDPAQVINAQPGTLTTNIDTIKEKADNLEQFGISASRAINGCASLLRYSVENVNTKLRALGAVARMWGVDKERLITLIEDWPMILSYSPSKIKTLARIANDLPKMTEFTRSDVSNAVTPNLEQVVVGHITSYEVLEAPKDIRRRARQYRHYSKEELRRIIAQHPSDPVAKSYFQGYPLDESN